MSGPIQAPDWGPVSLELPIDDPDATRPPRPATGEPVTSIDVVIVIDNNGGGSGDRHGDDDGDSSGDDDDDGGIRRRGNVIEIDLA